jgi:hypothetical protein
VFTRNVRRSRGEIAARELPRDQGVMPKRIGSGGWNNFRLLKIEAKPLQSEHSNQSHCEADGYISIRARFRKRNSVNNGVAKAFTNTARRAVVCRARLLATQERLDG